MKLYLLGSSRNEEDAKLVHSLREATKHLEISSYVEFVVNAPYSKLRELMQTVSIGIHSMWNEHFGISIVEMMASGMIMIAHNSGGPMKDIMVPLTGQTPHERIVGYVASSVVEYTDKLVELLNLSTMAAQNIRLAARQSVQERFGDDVVEKQVISLFNHILYPATYGLDIDSKSTDMILQANNSYRGNDGVNDDKQHTASSKRRSIKRKSLNKNKS